MILIIEEVEFGVYFGGAVLTTSHLKVAEWSQNWSLSFSIWQERLVQSTKLDTNALNQVAGAGPLCWTPRMSNQTPFHTLCDSGPLKCCKLPMRELRLMSRLIIDPLFVSIRESCPQLDGLCHQRR